MTEPVTPDPAAAPGAPATDDFDLLLRQHFADDAEPADAGFSHRVLAALPPRAASANGRWRVRARHAHWVALSVASGLAAALMSAAEGRIEGPQGVAALALLALLALWSWPARWLRPW